MDFFQKSLDEIRAVDKSYEKIARNHWDNLTHPTGSLGELEEISIKLAMIKGEIPQSYDKRAIMVMCADNGVWEEDISSSPKELTYLLAEAMAKGQTGVSALAKDAKSEVFVIDLGIEDYLGYPSVYNRRVRNSTGNFAKEPAMSKEEAIKAIEVGIEFTDNLVGEGYDLFGVGELGMGNTTTSAAVIALLTGSSEKEVVGLGSGVDSKQLANKYSVVRKAIGSKNISKKDPLDVLAKVGGLDIAGIVGVFLSAGKNKVPVVVDGITTAAAALIACQLKAEVKDYILASHIPKEKGARLAFNYLGIRAYLDLNMRLGEGSGCPLMFKLIDSAVYAMNHMAPFSQTNIKNVLVNLRDVE